MYVICIQLVEYLFICARTASLCASTRQLLSPAAKYQQIQDQKQIQTHTRRDQLRERPSAVKRKEKSTNFYMRSIFALFAPIDPRHPRSVRLYSTNLRSDVLGQIENFMMMSWRCILRTVDSRLELLQLIANFWSLACLLSA